SWCSRQRSIVIDCTRIMSSLSRYSGRGQGEGDLKDPVRRQREDVVVEITRAPGCRITLTPARFAGSRQFRSRLPEYRAREEWPDVYHAIGYRAAPATGDSGRPKQRRAAREGGPL